jgi:kynurenine formamidase
VTDEHDEPTNEEIRYQLEGRRNWGRWGPDDELGALNLITPERRLAALATVRTGEVFSLSRPVPMWAGTGNPAPASMGLRLNHLGGDNRNDRKDRAPGGSGSDTLNLPYHGVASTHLDSLAHVWDADGMYGGHDPEESFHVNGVKFGGVQHWRAGILTRCVLLDVPRFRGTEFVDYDSPVHGWELEAILAQLDIPLDPGDAVAVYQGREKWQAAHPGDGYGRMPNVQNQSIGGPHKFDKPGMHASCLKFLRDHDLSTLCWDMLDAAPYEYDVTYTVHGAIHAYGMALVDNVVLETLADECASRGQYDFMLVVAPLVVIGGTGSPVNPLAVL